MRLLFNINKCTGKKSAESTIGDIGWVLQKAPRASPAYIRSLTKVNINNFLLEDALKIEAKYHNAVEKVQLHSNRFQSWQSEKINRRKQIDKIKQKEIEKKEEQEKQQENEKAKQAEELSKVKALYRFEDLSVTELKWQCKKHYTKTSGTKKEIVDRLQNHCHPFLPETCLCNWKHSFHFKPSFYTHKAAVLS